jgi:redox-regulated HSP33 family molecular chaperone
MSVEELEELYENDSALHITCPRCGKQFDISRDELTT